MLEANLRWAWAEGVGSSPVQWVPEEMGELENPLRSLSSLRSSSTGPLVEESLAEEPVPSGIMWVWAQDRHVRSQEAPVCGGPQTWLSGDILETTMICQKYQAL